MSRASRNTRLLCWFAVAALFAGVTAAYALAPAGPNRPANVPENYVITPAGYFHPSCVAHLVQGDFLHTEEKVIEHADGSFDSVPACAYSHFKPNGDEVKPNGEVIKLEDKTGAQKVKDEPSIGHSYIEWVGATTGTSYGELGADWNVPAAPTTNNGQTIYLFPALDDANDIVSILQPVLGWNSDYADAWGIASWNCCVTGTVVEATPQRVNVGDKVAGYIWDNCASGTLTCTSWDILTYDLTAGRYSELMGSPNNGQTFNWAFAGALEVYNVAQCSNYPAAGSFTFYDLELYNDSFVEYSNPGWSYTNVSAGLTPQCGYTASVSATQTTLYY